MIAVGLPSVTMMIRLFFCRDDSKMNCAISSPAFVLVWKDPPWGRFFQVPRPREEERPWRRILPLKNPEGEDGRVTPPMRNALADLDLDSLDVVHEEGSGGVAPARPAIASSCHFFAAFSAFTAFSTRSP